VKGEGTGTKMNTATPTTVQPGENRERKAESRNWGVLVVSLTARESAG